MPPRIRHGLLIGLIFIALFSTVAVEYGYGTVIEYIYDKTGNLIERRVQPDITPPTTTASPAGGTYNTSLSVTLTCNDDTSSGTGSGCDKIYYTTNGSTPTTSSTVYSSPINISVTTTLKFFAKDRIGNIGPVNTQNYIIDMTPPTTTATPSEGTYSTAQSVTLTCSDGTGSGCDRIYYTTDGTTPTTSSPVYSSPISISGDTILKYFAKDLAGNTEAVKTGTYIIDAALCPNLPVRIGGASYITLQAAYNAAVNGDTIKCRAITFTEDLTINRDIAVTLDGGYDCGFTTNAGGRTTIRGMVTTTVGGGTLTIKNFILGVTGLPDTTPPVTTATPPGGTYSSGQSVTLSCSDGSGSGCDKIYYTTDGSTPTTSSTVYSSPIVISVTTTLKFFAKDLVGNSEAVKTQTYTIAGGGDTTPPTTTASPTGGTYNSAQSVALTCTDTGGSGCDKIYYTTDGSTPTTSSSVYSSPINISVTTTLKFFAKDLAGNSEAVKTQTYNIDTSLPSGTITINSGAASTNNTLVTLTLSCNDVNGCSQMQFSNDNITYSTPETYATTKAWTTTSGDETKTVYVRFKDTPGNWSTRYSDTILLDTTAPTTTPSPAAGAYYDTPQSVTLTCNDSAGSGCDKIYYTTDGSTPTTQSLVYSSPINISVTTTLKFFSKDLAGNSGAIESQVYTIDTSLCPNSPAKIGSTFYSTIQSAYNAAVNGDVIECRDITFTENLVVNRNIAVTLEGGYDCGYTTNVGGTTTIKGALTTTAGGGTITVKNFILDNKPGPDTTPPTTTATPAGGTYNSAQSVTLSCSDGSGSGCDKIYYTIDGSTPSTSSPVYSSPINISVMTTLEFFARDLAGNSEAVKTQVYTIDTTAPTTTVSPAGGTYNTSQSVTLSCNDVSGSGCDRIYYTTDGSTPTTSSAVYSSPINISVTTTLKFFARDLAGNSEAVKTQNYTIDETPPTTAASPAGGTYNASQSVTLTCGDSGGSGCDKIYYTTDGSTPSTSSLVYSTAINITVTTTLKFFARDLAGNSEAVKTQTYTINTGGGCSNPPVKIGSTFYSTLQSAYDAAVTGDIIKCQNVTFIENLTVNRNIIVRLEGGYDCGYTTNYGNMSVIRGMIRTTSGGGKITVKNFFVKK